MDTLPRLAPLDKRATAIGDCIAVATHGGTVGYALAVHGSAAVVVILIGISLLVEQRRVVTSAR